MDPRDRANAALARAQARAGVVTPDNMTSPMDAANTQQIPRQVVDRADTGLDPDTTTKLPSSMIEANDLGTGADGGHARDAARAAGDSHLAEPMPTTPLPEPTAGAAEPDTGASTRPLRTPAPQSRERTEESRPRDRIDASQSGELPSDHLGGTDQRETPAVAAGGASPARPADWPRDNHDHPDADADAGADGLVPTVRNEQGQSYLSRRLDGL